MKLICSVVVTSLLVIAATNVWAAEDDSYVGYESIVNELKADAEDTPREEPSTEDWNAVALHGGLSLVTSFVSIDSSLGYAESGMLKGFEAHFGGNLFTRQVRGELAFRNFAPENLGTTMQVDLKELEGRLIFLPLLGDRTLLRMGFGLGMRFIDVYSQTRFAQSANEMSYAASSVIIGFESKVSKAVSLGPDIAYRSMLTRSAPDQSAWDAAIRLNATF